VRYFTTIYLIAPAKAEGLVLTVSKQQLAHNFPLSSPGSVPRQEKHKQPPWSLSLMTSDGRPEEQSNLFAVVVLLLIGCTLGSFYTLALTWVLN
jgi:hypothetical protein